MPKKVFFGRSQTRSVAQQRMKDLQAYLQVCRELSVCVPVSHQEHIELGEHVTTVDGEIQAWLPDTNLVTSKYGKAATYACTPASIESPDTVQE